MILCSVLFLLFVVCLNILSNKTLNLFFTQTFNCSCISTILQKITFQAHNQASVFNLAATRRLGNSNSVTRWFTRFQSRSRGRTVTAGAGARRGPGRVSGRKSRQPEPVLVSCVGGGAGDTAGTVSHNKYYKVTVSQSILCVCHVQVCVITIDAVLQIWVTLRNKCDGAINVVFLRRICFQSRRVSES